MIHFEDQTDHKIKMVQRSFAAPFNQKLYAIIIL